MSENFFYNKLGYGQLADCSSVSLSKPEYRELEKTGADKVYFSGDFPAVLFKEVQSFDDCALREIAEIQRKTWNYRKVIFLFAMSGTEIRIYNCYEKPKYLKPDDDVNAEIKQYEIFKTQKDDAKNLAILVELFSQVGVDCGLLWTSEYGIRERVNVQRRIDRYLVQSLMETAKILGADIKNKDIIHGLLMRSLFILYLEDKGAAKEAGLYKKIMPKANSYFDILDDVDATYKLFDKLHEHFNGNVFPVIDGEQKTVTQEHLQKIKHCFIDGDLSGNPKLFDDWKIFDFSFIQIELLSEVYENFLGELKEKKEKGQFYTPYPLVELMLNDRLSIKNETDYNVKTLDIACGSGIFLVESYKRLIQRWKNAHPNENISFENLRDILLDNIYGIEIDPLAIKVAAFSLYLALVEQLLDPKTLWIKKKYRLPYLINNPDDPSLKGKQGNNLWRRDTISEVDAEHFVIKADLIVGNPPFGTDKISPGIKDYLNKRKYAQEKVLAFLDKAVQFANDDGKTALIFSTKVLTNTNKQYQNFRKWLFNKTYVEKVYNLSIFRKAKKDFGGQLFNSATVPVSIVYYQKRYPENISETIEYCAPKTYVKSNVVDGLIIDSTDIKFLPRHECQKPDTKIWKIAMWGNIWDFRLLSHLSNKFPATLKSYFKQNNWIYATGLNGDSEHKDFVPTSIIETKSIGRYYTPENVSVPNNTYYRKIDSTLFQPPFIVVKKGQKEKQITASYIDYNKYFKSGAYIINKNDNSTQKIKKGLVAFFNSDLAKYILFLSGSSWGIEREQIFFNEYLTLPMFFQNNSVLTEIIDLYDKLVITLKHDFLNTHSIEQQEKEINRKLESIINVSEKEQILIADTLKFSLDLFESGEKSIGFKRTLPEENQSYAEIICSELNDFLQHSSFKVNATVYDVRLSDPLNLIVLSFDDKKRPVTAKNAGELSPLLKALNDYSLQEYGQNIYVRKQYKYSDRDKIYLIKPNQKRFWTRSQAMEDAQSLIIKIANMGGVANE
ncbi:MAG: SAM-dependent methyltransferase [Bacteroidales bacterium]|jgi:predicted RNA methylase|nr:SAM-dependent methyltransferase [Bacteroidales bacterium]